ncbi:MAG TPA: hypothetical protein VKN74_08295 [Candidatus Mcinerneyibacterium sp.]|nr:hypothetical protein [Candidatus Mcinerneyibacterium sp.]
MKKKPIFRKEKAFFTVKDRTGIRIFESKGEIEFVLREAQKKFGFSGFHKLYNNVDKLGKKIKKLKNGNK